MERNNTLTALAMIAVVLLAAFAVPVTTVSAQSEDDGMMSSLFGSDEDEEQSRLETVTSFASGVLQKYNPLVERPESAEAEEYASNVQTTFNGNSEVLLNWTNKRVTASSDYDVTRIKFSDESGDTEYRYVVADVNTTTGNYTSVRMMNQTDFKELDRDIDTTYRLSPYASRNANEELETFITEYAEPGEDVNRSYLAKLAGEYRGEISGDDLPGGN